jgi:L-serine dehydratase
MRAAYRFCELLRSKDLLKQCNKVTVEIFGSLAHTGDGHVTNKAIVLGLENNLPRLIDPDHLQQRFPEIITSKKLKLADKHFIDFDYDTDFIFNRKELLPLHTNGMRFKAFSNAEKLLEQDYYSIGGGFVICTEAELDGNNDNHDFPFPFDTASELLELCTKENKTIAEIVFANESTLGLTEKVKQSVLNIADVMQSSIDKGMVSEGTLPGGLNVKRRAPGLAKQLAGKPESTLNHEHIASLDWLNVYAIAVNEENAAGSRVVTAPTNGAAGVLPAVLRYYQNFYPNVTDDKIIEFLLTAAAITTLFKKGASLSAAEVGCQGEVGVACSMAAGALTAVLGGTVEQVMSAAEIAMEHNLGLTCDPIGGLVQVPCIERNAIGAVKAVNVARLALAESGKHKQVSLDKVIATMRQTGLDMSHHYKETSLGGLAKINVSVVEC